MIRQAARRGGLLGIALAVAGCTAPAATNQPVRTVSAVMTQPAVTGLQSVIGRNAGVLVSQFGAADLDVREGAARKLQFVGPACVLDAYLYPPAAGREPIVTHVDARLLDGRDMDRASCVAALSQRQQVR